ncbi:hypothetical protein RY972_16285 [Aeromonas allosaccharophila]|uniref:Uncharacterized protein n=1 Tax=Aeromonas allosaccharophila TaxID=656 RepID=A0ABZ0F889_9GAMM|nr:hypothetical protein [Aeromonas allosaccharophila]WOE65588.1 hypothetical protein RY972_16285 [Aeromonas allosaccharophila]
MMDSHKWVLLGACMATLSGCGGSDDNKSTTATSVAPVSHVATTLKAGIALPQPGVYQTTLLTRDDPQQTLVNFAGLAIVYPQRDAQLRWDIWADDGAVATWWLGQAGMQSDSTEPSTLTLTRISRNKVADSAVLTRDDSGTQLVPSNYQRQSSVPSQVIIKTMPVIKAEGERVRYSAFDLSSTGTTVYHNWNGQVGITAVNTTNIKSETWLNVNGLATDMLGNTELTNNDGKLTIVMQLPSAGCTLFAEGEKERDHALSKLTFTGFEKCKFVEFNNADWSQSDYKNTAGLAQVKDTATAYIAEFNDANNKSTLVIGFPELDGVIFTLKKG